MKQLKLRRRSALLMALSTFLLAGAALFTAYIFRYSGAGEVREPTDTFDNAADYELEITPYPDRGALKVDQRVSFVGDMPSDRLVFCLPLNAFRRAETAPMDGDSFAEAFGRGYMTGGIGFDAIKVNGKSVEWGVSGGSEAILTLLCDVRAGEVMSVNMQYHVILPEFNGVPGFDASEWRLGEFYPYIARFEGGTWKAYAPTHIGEYNYAPVSDFDVTLHVPSGLEVISSGKAEIKRRENGWDTWHICAPDVRELGIVLRRGGCVYERETGGVKVRVYGRNRLEARRTVDMAAKVVARMNRIYEYPYPKLDIVTGGYAGRAGSYTGLIITAAAGAEAEAELVYLMARQWWGGLVLSDPKAAPWLNDALAQYGALLCASDARLRCFGKMRAEIDASYAITLPDGLTVDSESGAFNAYTDYDNVLRFRGTGVLELLDMAMEGRLETALSEFASAHAFGFADRADFVAALNAATGSEWGPWLDETLQGIGKAG